MYWKPPLRKRLQRNLTALAKWIVGLPYALFVTVPRVALGGSAEPPERPRRAELPSRIDVPFYTAPPEAGLARAAKAEFALLVRSQRWPELLARMRGLDRSRGTFKSGERAYRPALNGAIAAVVEPLAEPETGLRKAEAALAELETMFKAHAEDYTAAVILAHALFALAWTYRGGDAGDLAVEPSAEAEFSRLFAHAEAALDPFDPLEEDSPMLAEARYMLVAGVADGSEYMRDWYEDWADLDPVNPEMLRVHSRFLMPQWFGDYAEIEREARRAQKRAGEALGPGAYAAFWREPLARDPAALDHVDVGLFLDGVDRWLKKSRSQLLANQLGALLLRLSKRKLAARRPLAEGETDAPTALAAGFSHLLRAHLREIHLEEWEIGEDRIRALLVAEFRDELLEGARLVVGEAGLMARKPAG